MKDIQHPHTEFETEQEITILILLITINKQHNINYLEKKTC